MDGEYPNVCEIRGWDIFENGYWKGDDFYSPERVERIKDSFDELRGVIKPPILKLGHSEEQELKNRLEESLGWPSMGTVESLAFIPDLCRIRVVKLVNVPTELGGAINAGQFRGGSVELAPFIADPRDPSKRIDGPILRAIALLGEEPDALPHLPPPKAYFADGRLVPPKPMMGKLITAMAEVTRSYALGYRPQRSQERIGDRDYSLNVLCFSEFKPMPLKSGSSDAVVGENVKTEMEHGKPQKQAVAIALKTAGKSNKFSYGSGALSVNREQLIAALVAKGIAAEELQGMTDEQLQELAAGGEGVDNAMFSKMFSSMKKCYAAAKPDGNKETDEPGPAPGGTGKEGGGPAVTDPQQAPKWFSDFAEDMKKRVGAVEKFAEGMQAEKEEDQTKQFSERAGRVVDRLIAPEKGQRPKVLRRDRDLYVSQGVTALTTAKFGAVANDREAAFSAWEKDMLSRPGVLPDPMEQPLENKKTQQVDPLTLSTLRPGSPLELENRPVWEAMRKRHGLAVASPSNN